MYGVGGFDKDFERAWYILKKDDDYQIVSCFEGQDPLFGNGSWTEFRGPYSSWKEAEENVPTSQYNTIQK
jgi:hypothetical protein